MTDMMLPISTSVSGKNDDLLVVVVHISCSGREANIR